MSLMPLQEKILAQLIRQETLLSRLYSIFAHQFPDHEAFWKNLSAEEKKHAVLLERLRDSAEKRAVFFDEGNYNTTALQTYITRLESIVQKAEEGGFTIAAALANSLDYESSLIENSVFSRFASEHVNAKHLLKTLQSETMAHASRIREKRKALLGK